MSGKYSYNDVVVTDFDFKQLGYRCKQELDRQDDLIKKYIEVLTDITTSAVKSGELHDALLNLISIAESLFAQSQGMGKEVENLIAAFVDRIDDIDMHVYGEIYG